MSVFRRDVIESEGDTPDRVMRGHDGYALAVITAKQARSRHQTVSPAPEPDESAHTKVCGPKTDSTKKYFAKQSRWVIPPPK